MQKVENYYIIYSINEDKKHIYKVTEIENIKDIKNTKYRRNPLPLCSDKRCSISGKETGAVPMLWKEIKQLIVNHMNGRTTNISRMLCRRCLLVFFNEYYNNQTKIYNERNKSMSYENIFFSDNNELSKEEYDRIIKYIKNNFLE